MKVERADDRHPMCGFERDDRVLRQALAVAQTIADHFAFVAYSPAATLARTASAISFGSVMLNCCVERMLTQKTKRVSRIESYTR